VRALVISENRLAALGLQTLATHSGLAALPAMPAEAIAASRSGDLMLLYADAWDAETRDLVNALHAAHARFVVIIPGMEGETRRAILAAGALHAFSHEESDEIRSVLTNFRWSAEPAEDQITLANGFVIDLPRRRIRRGDRFLPLTLTECHILELLRDEAYAHPGRPLPPPQIHAAVWGNADARAPATLRGHIAQLRGKVEVDPEHPQVLLARRGHGYWLELAPNTRWRSLVAATELDRA
jgi:two-component system KDP operon response regulator KdpE